MRHEVRSTTSTGRNDEQTMTLMIATADVGRIIGMCVNSG